MKHQKKWIFACVAAAFFLPVLSLGIQQRNAFDRQVDRVHLLKDLRIVCWLYGQDHDGLWPPLSAEGPRFMYAPSQVRTPYAIDKPVQGKLDNDDPALVMGFLHGQKAYSLKPLSDAGTYIYLGYATTNEAEGLALAKAVRAATGNSLGGDLAVPAGTGTLGGDHFIRLNAKFDGGKSKEEAAQLRAKIPAIIERPVTDGKRSGGWVVYLDEHTEFVPYPGPFPMTETFISAFTESK